MRAEHRALVDRGNGAGQRLRAADLAALRRRRVRRKLYGIIYIDCDQYGRAAGPVRSQQMLDEGHYDGVALWHSRAGKGARI